MLTITTVGHDDRYSAEQCALMLLARDIVGDCTSTLTARGAVWHCRTRIDAGNRRGIGRVQRTISPNETAQEQHRLKRELVRESFYRAAVDMTGNQPVWGSLSGVKPGKVASRLLAVTGSADKTRHRLQREYHLSPERAALALDAALASAREQALLQPRDIGVYVGIPFCPTRCHYCSFVSKSTQREAKLIEPYLAALAIEIARVGRAVREARQRVVTLYIGGGTPTTLSASQLDALFSQLYRHFDLSALRELTCEAGRPDTSDLDKLRVLKQHGVTRVCVNPQTMQQPVLDAIGRAHTVKQVYDAVDRVRALDFDVLNMDVIAGLPNDTPDGFADTLAQIVALAPENITVHTLARKRGSLLDERSAVMPPPAQVDAMLDHVLATLPPVWQPYYLYRLKFMAGAGENIGWCRPGTDCAYNIQMMEELTTVLGLGAGSASKLHFEGGRIERSANVKFPVDYIAQILG